MTADGAAATRTARALAMVHCLLVWWALLFVLFLVFISTVSPVELALGAGAALVGAAGAEAVRRAEHPRVGGLRALGRAAVAFPPTLVQESGRLAAAVLRELRGGRHARRGGRGTGRTVRLVLEPGTSAAAAAALLSASPGACVIDIRQDRDPARATVLTMHLLDPEPSAVERALPGRRPR